MDEYYKDCDIIYIWDSEGSISEVGYIKSWYWKDKWI
jgi:hypothetical protein